MVRSPLKVSLILIFLLGPASLGTAESAAIAADRQALADAEKSGDSSRIMAAKEQLSDDLAAERPGARTGPVNPPMQDAPVIDNDQLKAVGDGNSCIHFAGCVDGADSISIQNYVLVYRHISFGQIGTRDSCPANLRFQGGGYTLDGVPVPSNQKETIGMENINSIKVTNARGKVTFNPGHHEVVLDDTVPAGAAEYDVDLCP